MTELYGRHHVKVSSNQPVALRKAATRRETFFPPHWNRDSRPRTRRGTSQNRIPRGSEILCCGKNDFIRRHAQMLKALAVLHDQISLRHRKCIVDLRTEPVRETVYFRFHNAPRAPISQNKASMFQLNHAGKRVPRPIRRRCPR